jgi:putative alpha-1,2-mannosidase
VSWLTNFFKFNLILTKVIIRVATSLISADQALDNYNNEVDNIEFDDAVSNAQQIWNTEMSRVKVTDVGEGYSSDEGIDRLTVFYSTLYRASKYPRVMWEIDADSGEDIHW